MKAITFDQYGSPGVLRVEDVATPRPANSQVLVRVHAASINDWDWGLIRGETTNRIFNGLLKPKKVHIPGCDVAGIVEAVGSGISRFQPGDEVYGDLCLSGFGSFAEYVAAPESAFCKKPAAMTFEQAAAIPQAAMLAIQGLIDIGEICPRKTRVLINGAGGGVGTIGLQLAKAFGVDVTCVDRESKFEMLLGLGAYRVLDYQHVDFTREGRLYDLILDTRSTRSPWDYIRALAPNGSYVTVGGELPRLFQLFVLQKIVGRSENKQIRIVGLKPNKDLLFVNKEFEEGRLVPVIDSVYQLEETAEAMQRYVSGEFLGKVVIRID